MTKPFAASAFRAYASFDVSDAQRSSAFFTDGPRDNAALPRWADAPDSGTDSGTDWGGAVRGSVGAGLVQPWVSTADLLDSSAMTSTAADLFAAAATGGDFVLRCGCPSCAAAAQTQAEKAAYAEAAWAAYQAPDPGETALGDDISDGPSDATGAEYHILDAQEGDSAHSQIDHPLDQDWFLVELSGDQSYKFVLTPDDQGSDPPAPDLLIEIYDSAGTLLQTYDSGSWGAVEEASFTPDADGTYYVAVKGWTPADVGGYTLTAEINNEGGPTGGTPLAAINWGGDDNVVDTGNYTAGGQMIIKVYFSQTGDLPYGSADDPVVGLDWDGFAKDAAYSAFACYENIINIVFQEVATQEEADFILAATATAPVILGRMRPPGEPNEGLGEFNVLASTWTEEGLAQGAYMYITLIHELGHGMGLSHPHDTGGGSEVMAGVGGSLATGYTYGDFDLNQGVFTTMSYNDGWQTAPHGNTDSDDYGYQGTLMALDVAMLQIKYGANTTYNSGDTVYALPTSNQAGTFYSCIWDTGGTDWLIAGAGIDCIIDLRPATLQYEEGGGGFVSYASNIYGGYTIANGVVIENAIGGAGEDVMTGNTAANWLMGGLGDDSILGGDGDDRIEGGEDDDLLDGGAGTDLLDYTYAAGGITIDLRLTTAQNTGGAGIDTISGFEGFLGSDFADNVTGSVGADDLSGADGADRLHGHLGDDLIDGGDGDDVLIGGRGIDETTGGLGDDWHYVDNAADTIVETAGQGSGDRVLASVDFALAADDDVEKLTTQGGSADINLTGNALAQRIEGNSGANILSGLDGNDSISGYDGADTLIGGFGDDLLRGGNGADTFRFNAGLFGNDTVADFADGSDLIDFSGLAGVDDFSDLVVTANGGNALITMPDGSTITLTAISDGLVDASDFVFGP